MENNEIIVVRQLPIIEEQLRTIQQDIKRRVDAVLELPCTEDTVKEIKKERAALNAEYKDLEERRKAVKAAVEKPYKDFEKVYKAFAGDLYVQADRELASRIQAVEGGVKQAKQGEVMAYFDEYRASLGLPEDLVDWTKAGINVTLSASLKSLKEAAKTYLDRVKDDLILMERYDRYDEILDEYRRCGNAARSVQTVYDRHARIEEFNRRQKEAAEQRRREQEHAAEVAAAIEVEQISIPEVMEVPPEEMPEPVEEPVAAEPAEPTFPITLRVTGTLAQLKAMKKFLNDGGYTYEQL